MEPLNYGASELWNIGIEDLLTAYDSLILSQIKGRVYDRIFETHFRLKIFMLSVIVHVCST